jgi:hypothetical protein
VIKKGPTSVKLSISLPDRHGAVVEELAGERWGGNVSAMVRELLDTHPVTKSRLALPTRTTPRSR